MTDGTGLLGTVLLQPLATTLVFAVVFGKLAKFPSDGIALEETLEEIERQIILQVSEKTNWNQTKASKLLQMNRDKLRYRMKQYDLARETARSVS